MSKSGLIGFARRNELKPEDTAHFPDGPSLTRQEFKDECDINTIMARYDSYLADPMGSLRDAPVYLDLVAKPGSLMEAMQVLKDGEEAFMRLPAKVRREFDNDAAMFVDFAVDPANLKQMQEWGLAPAPEPEVAPIPAGAPAGGPGTAPGAVPGPGAGDPVKK